MQPEDIDKLFRDQLAGHAPTPPAYLWNQLEEELQPPKKRPVMWLWAAAASVLLLLATGVAWLQQRPAQPTGAGTLAEVAERPQHPAQATARPEKKPALVPQTQATPSPQLASTPPTAAPLQAPVAARPQPQEAHLPARPQATAAATAAVTANHRPRAVRPADQSPQPQQPAPAATVAAALPAPEPRPALTAALVPAPRTLPAAAPTGPIVVEVHRSEPAVATAADDDSGAGSRPRLGQLLRQARHVVRGERVSLSEAGLPETVTLQARVAGHTLTKVIQL